MDAIASRASAKGVREIFSGKRASGPVGSRGEKNLQKSAPRCTLVSLLRLFTICLSVITGYFRRVYAYLYRVITRSCSGVCDAADDSTRTRFDYTPYIVYVIQEYLCGTFVRVHGFFFFSLVSFNVPVCYLIRSENGRRSKPTLK